MSKTPLRLSLLLATVALTASACGPSGGSGASGGSAADAKPKTTAELLAELPAPYNMGDPNNGKVLFAGQCAACHTLTKGGSNGVGPNLYGFWGQDSGHNEDFNYSPALHAGRWTWGTDKLNTWITDPKILAPPTRMIFAGIKDPNQRRDIIAFLRVASTTGGTL